MAALHYAEHVHIAQTRTQVPTPYFCTEQESETESVSGNVNGPVNVKSSISEHSLFRQTLLTVGHIQSCRTSLRKQSGSIDFYRVLSNTFPFLTAPPKM